jgi:general secretion pathway protein L
MSSLSAFFNWWGRELAAMLPTGLRRVLWPRPDLVLAAPTEAGLALARTGRRREDLGLASALDKPVLSRLRRSLTNGQACLALVLPPSRMVLRDAALPMAAEADLAKVMSFEIDRLTPFPVDEIYYGFQVRERNAASGKLTLDLAFTPKDAAQADLDRLAGLGLKVDRLDAAGTDGAPLGFNLLPDSGPRSVSWSTRISAVLLLASLLFSAAAGYVALSAREARVEELRGQVAEARRAAIASQDAVTMAGDPAQVFAYRLKTETTRAIDVLLGVTDALPDTAWLETLSHSEGRVSITGVAADASALIGVLEAHPLFANPVFQSPVTPDDQGRGQRFSLAAEVSAAEMSPASAGSAAEGAE